MYRGYLFYDRKIGAAYDRNAVYDFDSKNRLISVDDRNAVDDLYFNYLINVHNENIKHATSDELKNLSRQKVQSLKKFQKAQRHLSGDDYWKISNVNLNTSFF